MCHDYYWEHNIPQCIRKIHVYNISSIPSALTVSYGEVRGILIFFVIALEI